MGYKYDDDTGALPRNYIVVDCRGTDLYTVMPGQSIARVYMLGNEWYHSWTLDEAIATAAGFSMDCQSANYGTLSGGGFCVFEYVYPTRSTKRRDSISDTDWVCLFRCVNGRVVSFRFSDYEYLKGLGYVN